MGESQTLLPRTGSKGRDGLEERHSSQSGSSEQGLDVGSSPAKTGNLFAFRKALPMLTPREEGGKN